MGRSCAGARGGSGPRQHRARPDRPGAAAADLRRRDRGPRPRRRRDRVPARTRASTCNPTLAEQPNGDFGSHHRAPGADRCVSAGALRAPDRAPPTSAWPTIAAKAVKETRYHLRYSAAGWCASATAPRRATRACSRRSSACGRYTRELFDEDELDREMAARGIAPRACGRCAPLGRRASRRCWPRRRSSGRRIGRIRWFGKRGAAQRAPRLHARRHAVPAARLSGSALVTGLHAARSGASGGRSHGRGAAALSAVEDPEIPALSLVDLGIIRFVETQADGVLEVGLSPTYTGLPGDRSHPAVGGRGARGAPGFEPFASLRAVARLDQRLDQRRGATQARRLRHRAAGAGGVASARQVLREPRPIALPALQLAWIRNAQRIWLDALQSAASLPRLPGAFRVLQMHLAGLAC